jgi:hypothetical protein
MSRDPYRWEVGSLFHAAGFEAASPAGPRPWEGGVLTGCGRDALRLIATLGRHRRWWLPSYFCQQVVEAVAHAGIELAIYPDSPLTPCANLSLIRDRPGDAVLVLNYFGLRGARDVSIPDGFRAEIIEDHTHAPTSAWACSSKADFCFVSLRKLYPLADGGAVWSPRGHSLPDSPPVTEALQLGAFEKLSGMLLKRLYLEGHAVTRQDFRPILESGEGKLVGTEISSITPLSQRELASFPLSLWDSIQTRNFQVLVRQLPSTSGFRVLKPRSETCIPFSAFCVFDQEEVCNRVRGALIEDRIYPSRLWPLDEPLLEGVPEDHAHLSRRSFSIPIDMRYGVKDMQKVGAHLAKLLAA